VGSIGNVDHINIIVSDLERSARFYTELLGFEETRRAQLKGIWIEAIVGLAGVEADVVYVQPPGDGPRIELLFYRSPQGQVLPENALANTIGLRHIALRVHDMDATYARLKEAGVEFIGPPTAVPGSVVKHDEGRKRLCYFRDPDGVLLELAEYT
jgi:catechol 2,3-dioxygenase-like lactoylglutathione lyase family enzyme